mgnify:CR=1 FL=1
MTIAGLDVFAIPLSTRFRGITNSALYPFGHGLTYGKIEYSEFALSARSLGMNGEITVTLSSDTPKLDASCFRSL